MTCGAQTGSNWRQLAPVEISAPNEILAPNETLAPNEILAPIDAFDLAPAPPSEQIVFRQRTTHTPNAKRTTHTRTYIQCLQLGIPWYCT
eukprot:143354-Prymnesium_polylepis.2